MYTLGSSMPRVGVYTDETEVLISHSYLIIFLFAISSNYHAIPRTGHVNIREGPLKSNPTSNGYFSSTAQPRPLIYPLSFFRIIFSKRQDCRPRPAAPSARSPPGSTTSPCPFCTGPCPSIPPSAEMRLSNRLLVPWHAHQVLHSAPPTPCGTCRRPPPGISHPSCCITT
ncbi:hypothetical protein BD779DRAFT_158613 [Infundibulicybe gibba]|nr:hypothetical protein BD779DRAFT_158613 [Infundibulicybe gibba]